MAAPTHEPAPFRLAFRAEGEFVNCYYAAADTMSGATLLGSMRRSLFESTPGVFHKWQALLQEILAAACVDVLGDAPQFETKPAPEHERSGRA